MGTRIEITGFERAGDIFKRVATPDGPQLAVCTGHCIKFTREHVVEIVDGLVCLFHIKKEELKEFNK